MDKLYTLPEPHGSHVAHVLNVGGAEKPVGYVSYTKIEQSGFTPEQLRSVLEKGGMKVLELTESPSQHRYVAIDSDTLVPLSEPLHAGNRGPLFYTYDEQALQALLDTPKACKTLRESGWPNTAEAFVRKLHHETACPKTAIFDLISDAFGSTRHPGRLDQINTLMPHYENLRNKPAIKIQDLPVCALRPEHDAQTYREILEKSTLPDGSQQHYIAQAEAIRGVVRKDWLDRLQDAKLPTMPATER